MQPGLTRVSQPVIGCFPAGPALQRIVAPRHTFSQEQAAALGVAICSGCNSSQPCV